MKTGLALAACLALTACGIHIDTDEKSGDIKSVHISIANFADKHGDGRSKTETRELGAVSMVDATGPVDVDIKIGSTPSLTVSGDANLLALVETDVKDGRLTIKTRQSYSSDEPLRVSLTTPSLTELHNTGSGDITVTGLQGGEMRFDSTGSGDTKLAGTVTSLSVHMVGSGDLNAESLSPAKVDIDVLGSGDAKLGTVTVDRFTAAVKGSGSVTAAGTAKALSGNVLGSGDLSLAELRAEKADIELLGSGDVTVYASQAIHARAIGSGEIKVLGKPAKQELSGEHVSLD
jgi:hypothetical protein